MNLSDLLRAEVFDASGERLGRVVDVRLIQDGPTVDGFGASLRVAGLVVGRRQGLAVRLGYDRGNVTGPWLLQTLFSALERKAGYVEWSDVAEWRPEDGRLELAIEAAQLVHGSRA